MARTRKSRARTRSRSSGAEWAVLAVLVVLIFVLWRALSWGVVALVAVPAVMWVLVSQWNFLHTHRRRLAPVTLGFAVAALAVASRTLDSPWSWAVYAALIFGIGWAIHLEESGDHRVYFTACLLAAVTWSAAAHALPIDRWVDLAASWLVLVVLATAFWWTDRQVARAVQIEDGIRSWPELVKGSQLEGTRRPTFKEKPEGGWRMRLVWSEGQKMVDDVMKQSRLIESLMNAPRRSVTVEADGDDPNAVIVECSPSGVLGALEWDGQPLVSITENAFQARYNDGSQELSQRWEPGVGGKHKLRAGMTRCLSGDTMITINRGGIGKSRPLREIVARFNGKEFLVDPIPVDIPRTKRGTGGGPCSVAGCDNAALARTLCIGHYRRWNLWGDPKAERLMGPAWDLSIPTFVQREVDGIVRLGRVKNAWSSGIRTTYTLTTNTGRTIRATDQHPFLTVRGWVKLGELVPGDQVHTRGTQAAETPGRGKSWYNRNRVGSAHPYASQPGHVVGRHRLVVEAELNGLPFQDYLGLVRAGAVDGLQFINPETHHVHHKDENARNNDLSNLEVLTVRDHMLHHSEEWGDHVLYKVTTETVESIEVFGEEETFDIEVEDEPHNFIADGFVVHNSGKSISMKYDACLYGPAEDVVLWLIDRKGGVAFRPLAPLADWFAVDEDECVQMLEAAVRLCDARSVYMAEQGWDVWQPSREHPVVMLMIDETARLLGFQAPSHVQGRALTAAIEIGQLGAGVGVLIDPATQFPTLEALGSSQFREQLAITECYRQRSEGTAQHFLPNAPAGVEPAHIRADRKGEHFIDAEGIFRPMRAQKPNVTPEQVAEVVSEFWESTPEIEARHHAVLGDAYAARTQWALIDGKVIRAGVSQAGSATRADRPVAEPEVTPQDDPLPSWHDIGDGEPTFREMVAAERAAMSPEERRAEVARQAAEIARLRPANPDEAPALVLDLMRRVHPEPVAPRHAMEATGLSETTVHRLLRKWEDEGLVSHVGRGAYQLARDPALV